MSMLKDWNKAKLEFEKLTSRKKPSETTMLGFRASTGIESAIKAYEKTMFWDVAASKEEAAVKNLSAKALKYAVVLKKAIAQEPAETKPAIEKALVMLRTRLKRYIASAEAHLASKQADAAGKGSKTAALHKRAASDVKSAAMAVKAAAAKIKAQPTVEVYDDEIAHTDTMRRALYYVTLAREAGDQSFPDPSPYDAKIKPYYEGQYRRAAPDANADKLIKQASDAYAVCKEIYGVFGK